MYTNPYFFWEWTFILSLIKGNFLVKSDGTPCITDFALSRILSNDFGLTITSEPAGSLRWMAPELFEGGGTSNLAKRDLSVWYGSSCEYMYF